MGSGYVIEHCVTALSIIQKENMYRNYVTNSLYAIANTLGNAFGVGDIILKRYDEWIKPQAEADKTEEEVIEHIQERLRALG